MQVSFYGISKLFLCLSHILCYNTYIYAFWHKIFRFDFIGVRHAWDF